ncbi:MAG: 50S ribosomal protein L35 [Deltaproteobacteria bacterium]|nr:50S ribosomal protein L35 [Deltaproteobacteria bacterium]
MPKLKTKRGAKKRFKITASGKVKRKKAYLRHIMSAKSRKQKRKLRGSAIFSKADQAGIKRLLPYG